jgi:hypothetical protein
MRIAKCVLFSSALSLLKASQSSTVRTKQRGVTPELRGDTAIYVQKNR